MADPTGPKDRNAAAASTSSEQAGMRNKGPNATAPAASASSEQAEMEKKRVQQKEAVLHEVQIPIPPDVPRIKCRLEVQKPVSDGEPVAWIRISIVAQMAAILLAAMSWFSIVLGRMAFLWATVVLLGASIQQLRAYDFWLITALIFTEGVRVFLSSYEFKLRKNLFLRKGITWTASLSIPGFFISLVVLIFETCMLACTRVKPYYSREILPLWSYGVVLYVLQFGSAGIGFAFSVERLKKRDNIHLQNEPGGEAAETQLNAVLLFYALVVAETSLFLATRMVWDVLHWMMVMQTALFKRDTARLYLLEEFFFEVHETAVASNFVDASHMSLLSHTVSTLLLSDEPNSRGESAQFGMNLFRQRVIHLKWMLWYMDDANSRWINCLLKLMDPRFSTEIRKIAMDVLLRVLEKEAEDKRVQSMQREQDAVAGSLLQQIAFDGKRIEALQKGIEGLEGEAEFKDQMSRLVSGSLNEDEKARMLKWTDIEQGSINPAPSLRQSN